jgi:tetratricopeptide (TPR) repeat protein
MIINSGSSTEKEQFVLSPPQFRLESPKESPFEALPATSVTSLQGSFRLSWVENEVEIGMPRAQGILDDIVMRSRLDAERFPSDAFVHSNYGLALMHRGLLEESAKEFLAAVQLSPRHFMSLANLARIRTLQGQFDEAEAIYKELSTAYPNELSPLVNLSYIHLRTQKFDEATRILQSAIRIDYEAIFPRYLMAVSLLMLGKAHEAIGHLRIATRSEVRSPALYQTLGVAYLMAGDSKGAVRSFKTALTLAPDMKQAVRALANVLLEQNHTESLIELLSAYLEKHSDDIRAREILSEAYWRRREYPSARLQLVAALRQLHDVKGSEPQRASLLNNAGACFDRLGDSDAAVQWITRSIQLCPTFDPVPYQNLGRILLRKGQFTQACQILEKCKTKFPTITKHLRCRPQFWLNSTDMEKP